MHMSKGGFNMDTSSPSLDINKSNKSINTRIKRVFRPGKILKIKKKNCTGEYLGAAVGKFIQN